MKPHLSFRSQFDKNAKSPLQGETTQLLQISLTISPRTPQRVNSSLSDMLSRVDRVCLKCKGNSSRGGPPSGHPRERAMSFPQDLPRIGPGHFNLPLGKEEPSPSQTPLLNAWPCNLYPLLRARPMTQVIVCPSLSCSLRPPAPNPSIHPPSRA